MPPKTLNDLESEVTCNICKGHMVGWEELKTEAIKWVKEYSLSPFGTFCVFFNITLDDLK